MLFEALDITIESRGASIWLSLAGPFTKEQVPHIRTKIEHLIRDGNRDFVIDLEKLTVITDTVAPMFLHLLNLIRGKKGDIKLIFKNDIVYKAFQPYRNIFSIYQDEQSLTGKNFLHYLHRRGKILSKKTGIRLSVPVSLLLLFLFSGWFISLGYILKMQRKQITNQEGQLHEFQQWKQKAEIELNELRSRIKPLKQLGLVSDTTIVR
ncbi:MAG: STAS domain-containing protein [Chitinivibrionales bacterium]|nr:STAS domain-containing protein [Chitinivibrionales bacterium]